MTVCFVDTETTGLDPDAHEIWEVGLILPDGTEYEWTLPVDLGRADMTALKIGRYYDRAPDAITVHPVAFAERFSNLTRGLHLAGVNVSFDEERLRKLLRANGACPGWHYHQVDVLPLAAGKVGMAPPWKSSDVSLAVGVDPADFDRHSALGDARWTKAIYDAVMGA